MVRSPVLPAARRPLGALLGERARLVRFALTGVVAGLTQLVLLELLLLEGLPALAANALAFLLAAQVNFWLSHLFTWRDRAGDGRSTGILLQLGRFHASIMLTALLNLGVFALAVTAVPEGVAALLGIAAAAAANFVSGDRFVFRRAKRTASAGAAPIQDHAVVAPPSPEVGGGAHRAVDLPTGNLETPSAEVSAGPPSPAVTRGRWGARWEFVALAAVVLLAAGLYTWNLGRNGYGNEYYTAAALSGALSWKAFFFGALDPGSFITVDKPPLAVWVQALSVRVFGLSSWSVLAPQAIMALVTLLAVIWMTRRQFGGPAALVAGLTLALTPITVAVTRVNLPDTVMILVMTLGAGATLAAIRSGSLRWLLLGVGLVGLGFNAKMLQAFIVAPAFFLAYLVAAPGGLLRRLAHLTVAGVTMLMVAGSWMAVVDQIPPAARPYIGGSSNNTVLDLTLGYNGLGRVFGQGLTRGADPAEIVERVMELVQRPFLTDQSGSAAQAAGQGGPGGFGGPGGPGFGGQPGPLRLFNQQIGGQIGWLLPLAAVSLLAGLIAPARRPRTDIVRAWYVLWGGWFVLHAVVFSFASGILHPYYTAAFAPSVAALCGPGVVTLWQGYHRRWWLAPALPAALAGAAAVAVFLVSRSGWGVWLSPVIVGAVAVSVVGLLVARVLLARESLAVRGRRVALSALAVGLVGVLLGPAAWAVTPLAGGGMAANPLAGPADSLGGPGGRGGPPVGMQPPPGFQLPPGFQPPAGLGAAPDGQTPSDPSAPDGQRQPGAGVRQGRNGGGGGPPASINPGQPAGPGGQQQAGGPGGFGGPGGPGGPGGRVNRAMLAYLQAQRGSTEYLVAVSGSMAASPIILETRLPVIAMGGFSGGDPTPTADDLARLVAEGRLRFVLLGGRGGGPGGGGGVSAERATWVQASCSPVDPSTYDPSAAASAAGRDQLYDCAPPATLVQPAAIDSSHHPWPERYSDSTLS